MNNQVSTQLKAGMIFIGVLLGLMCALMANNTSELQKSNEIEQQEEVDILRAEYQRVLLGCQTAGAIESEDPLLRELCDETLPLIREKMVE